VLALAFGLEPFDERLWRLWLWLRLRRQSHRIFLIATVDDKALAPGYRVNVFNGVSRVLDRVEDRLAGDDGSDWLKHAQDVGGHDLIDRHAPDRLTVRDQRLIPRHDCSGTIQFGLRLQVFLEPRHFAAARSKRFNPAQLRI
jgi:hypothetical protein